MGYSPPGSSGHGILWARILRWVAISFPRGSSRPRDQTQVCCIAGQFFTNWASVEYTSCSFFFVSPSSISHFVYWRRQWHPTPVLLPGKSHGRRSLLGCSPWGRWESGTTERLHFHFYALEKEMAGFLVFQPSTFFSTCLMGQKSDLNLGVILPSKIEMF